MLLMLRSKVHSNRHSELLPAAPVFRQGNGFREGKRLASGYPLPQAATQGLHLIFKFDIH